MDSVSAGHGRRVRAEPRARDPSRETAALRTRLIAPARLIPGWSAGLPDYAPEKIEKQVGVPAATIARIAREAAAQCARRRVDRRRGRRRKQTAYFNAMAVNALNALLGSVGKPGGILFTPAVAPKPELVQTRNAACRKAIAWCCEPFRLLLDESLSGV